MTGTSYQTCSWTSFSPQTLQSDSQGSLALTQGTSNYLQAKTHWWPVLKNIHNLSSQVIPSHNEFIYHLFNRLEDKRPIGRFLLVLADGPLALWWPFEQKWWQTGCMAGPFEPLSKNWWRTGWMGEPFRPLSKNGDGQVEWEGPLGPWAKMVTDGVLTML